MTACTGVNQQYENMTGCMKACAFMPAGTPTDYSGNTAGCRMNAAMEAGTQPNAIKPGCWEAGPLSYGRCGNDCDLFCTVAVLYCSAIDGYDGVPPYASMDECESDCGLYNRVIDFGVPGSYAVNYVEGPTVDTTDTLECRASHLFIQALRGGGDQTLHCAVTGPVSGACGSGPTP
jgi:hypothetical protein